MPKEIPKAESEAGCRNVRRENFVARRAATRARSATLSKTRILKSLKSIREAFRNQEAKSRVDLLFGLVSGKSLPIPVICHSPITLIGDIQSNPLHSRAMARRCQSRGNQPMSNDNSLSLSELDDRIAVLRDNIRQLVEQAAASSGAQDEERTSGRMAQQQEELDKLVKARNALLKNRG